MRMALYFILAAGLLAAGCGRKNPPKPVAAETKTNEPSVGDNPLLAPVNYLGALNKAQKTAEKVVDTTSIKKAIDFFYANEERFPTDLNEIVTKRYIGRIPDPPYGKKFEYNPKTGDFRVVDQ